VIICGEDIGTVRLRHRMKWVTTDRPRYDGTKRKALLPTDNLALVDGSLSPNFYARDTETGERIEDDLKRVIVRWVRAAVRERNRRLQHEAAQQQREEERLAKEKHETRIKLRRERLDRLRRQAEDWKVVEGIRKYVTAVIQAARERDGRVDPDGRLARWIAWATRRADELDPTKRLLRRVPNRAPPDMPGE
jgi:hypothetical protein